ncbi:ABC transporter substrate-binding protein [Actinoplanes sp. CA-030573]|uniref:ABC transporter substrate-binding protein n=1 Tax=Actinoplanes sp. CA-030573 TaxID=3239898 RepID=UPI003D8B68BD
MRRTLCLAAVALVTAAGLVACGDDSDPAQGPAASAAPGKGGVLTLAAAQAVKEINPALKGTAYEQNLFTLLWNGLVKIGESNALEPDLATSWKSDAALKVWTFQLRPGVKFSNGKALTADDVVKTFRYYQDDKTATQLKNNVEPITNVEASGPATVVFTLKTANALFPSSIEQVKIIDLAALDTMATKPAVTGPFRVKEFVANETLTLERNPDYFGTPPPLDGIKFVKAADAAAAVTSLRSGAIDALWSVPLSDIRNLEQAGNVILKPKVISQYVSLEVDTRTAPFSNPKVREALAYAFDQKAILKAAYFDQGVVSTTNNPLPANDPNYAGNLTDYTYNPQKAKALFEEAGVKELTYWGVSNQYPEWKVMGQILQASLKDIGVNLKIENTEIATWAEKFYPAGKQFGGLIVPNFQSFAFGAENQFRFPLSGRCECNWNNKQFDDLYNQALATADDTARKAIWGQLQELVNKEAPIFVPLQFVTATATNKKVRGAWVDSAGDIHLETAGLAG